MDEEEAAPSDPVEVPEGNSGLPDILEDADVLAVAVQNRFDASLSIKHNHTDKK